MACLFSFSRRNFSPKWFYKTSRHVVLHHIKDHTESSIPQSSLLIRSFLRENFFQDRTKISSVQPMGSGVFLCRQMSSSSKPEEPCMNIDGFGNVVEELVPEKSVEAVATTVSTIDECSAAIGNFACPEDCVQYVINGIHELTGFNWWMSIVLTAFLVNGLMSPVLIRIQRQAWELEILVRGILKVQRIIKIGDPKTLAKSKKWEAELMEGIVDTVQPFLILNLLDALIYISFINGISSMAKKIPAFESGGIFWFTDLSTPDSFYILPLMTGFIFWLTAEICINRPNRESRMKRLPLFPSIFIALQAAYGYESAVYFYLIPSRLTVCALFLMLETKQMVKLSRTKVSESAQKMRKARVVSLMKEIIDVVTKKDKR